MPLALMFHLPKQITQPLLTSDVQGTTTSPCVWKNQVFPMRDHLMVRTAAQAQSLDVTSHLMLITQGSGTECHMGLD